MADKPEGFEDLNAGPNEVVEDAPDSEGDADADVIEEGAEDEVTDAEEETDETADDSANEVESLKATIQILQTEAGLKDAEIERWKGINLQLLMNMPNDGSVSEEDDSELDDPAPYEDTSGASNRFTVKE